VLKSVPEPPTRLAMLKNQEADVAYGLFDPLAEEVRRNPSLQLEPMTPAGTVAKERLNFLYVDSTFTLLGFCVLLIRLGMLLGHSMTLALTPLSRVQEPRRTATSTPKNCSGRGKARATPRVVDALVALLTSGSEPYDTRHGS